MLHPSASADCAVLQHSCVTSSCGHRLPRFLLATLQQYFTKPTCSHLSWQRESNYPSLTCAAGLGLLSKFSGLGGLPPLEPPVRPLHSPPCQGLGDHPHSCPSPALQAREGFDKSSPLSESGSQPLPEYFALPGASAAGGDRPFQTENAVLDQLNDSNHSGRTLETWLVLQYADKGSLQVSCPGNRGALHHWGSAALVLQYADKEGSLQVSCQGNRGFCSIGAQHGLFQACASHPTEKDFKPC